MTFSLSETYKKIEHILSFWSVQVEDIDKNTHDKVMFIQMKPFLHDSLSCTSYCMQGLLYPLNTLALQHIQMYTTTHFHFTVFTIKTELC